MKGLSKDEKIYNKQLICEVEKGVKDFEDGRIKTHEEVFSKFKKPINIHEITDEEFNDKMEKSIKDYKDGNYVSIKDFNKTIKKEYDI